MPLSAICSGKQYVWLSGRSHAHTCSSADVGMWAVACIVFTCESVLSEEMHCSAEDGVWGCLDSPYEFQEFKGWGVVKGSLN
jgi:hypothetical protein